MGQYTTNGYFYIPDLGASGSTERDTWLAQMEVLDALLHQILRLLTEGSKGDMIFINTELIGGAKYFDRLSPVGQLGQVITTEGTVPLWDWVGGLPGAETLLQTTKLIFIFSLYETSIILISAEIEADTDGTLYTDFDFDALEEELGWVTSTAEDIIAMDEEQDLTVEPSLDYELIVA